MKIDKVVILICAAITIFLSAVAHAQNAQWLQYHNHRNARGLIGDMVLQTWSLTPEIPQKNNLPKFQDQNPLFCAWSSPLAPDTPIWIALDRTNSNIYNQLWIDTNANGSFQDESPMTANRTDSFYAYFDPVKITFPAVDGPIVYHLYLEYYLYQNQHSLRACPACWYEGQITVGSKKLNCILIDHNTNGAFNDTALDPAQRDRIRLGPENNRKTSFVGRYLEIDNTIYQLEIAPDGAFVKLHLPDSIPQGAVKLPDGITEITAGGAAGFFTRTPKNQTVTLPTGEYRLERWTRELTDEKNNLWRLQAENPTDHRTFKVDPRQEINLLVGDSLSAVLSVQKLNNATYSFNQHLKGARGENLTLLVDGEQPPPPKLHIKNPDGSYHRTFSFEYG